MHSPSEKNTDGNNRYPLVPIGIIVVGILTLPVLFYSTGPEGPVKEGDVVFSTGRHHVYFSKPTQYHELGYQTFCVLEPREQLVVVERLADRTEGTLLGQVLEKTRTEFPFCPSDAQVILKRHQATLKVDTWGGIHDTLAHLFSTK